MKSYDAIVVGLGGMGSAALYHLAKRGLTVLGLEQHGPAHNLGASHGKTRIIRQAYYEHSFYVPLLRRAYELWHELQGNTPAAIWQITGGLTVGRPDAPVVAGALSCAEAYGIPHEVLAPGQTMQRFGAVFQRADEIALYEPSIGILFPEACVLAHLQAAVREGAEARFGQRVDTFDVSKIRQGIIQIRSGEQVRGERIVLCAGAWLGELTGRWPLQVERNVQHWFESDPRQAPAELPVFMIQRPEWSSMLYGFPDLGEGIKAAFHHSEVYVDRPELLDRTIADEEVEVMLQALRSVIPRIGKHIRSSACMYAMTPDEHFIIGPHPDLPNVFVAGGFSGHGFKFCSVVGEILTDYVIHGTTDQPVDLFDPNRFALEPG